MTNITSHNPWEATAMSTGARVFPVIIRWDQQTKKWTKKPLVKAWQNVATTDTSQFSWHNANGFGMLMGSGWYAIDLDDYKDGCEAQDWLRDLQVNTNTRTHGTASGGRHLIYRTIGEFENMATRQNVVKGLDTRGSGGFITFGHGYQVLNPADPAVLSPNVCLELVRSTPNATRKEVILQPIGDVDEAAVMYRLNAALTFGRETLKRRWHGDPGGLQDTSTSSYDFSVAKLLGMSLFTHDEIYWLLTRAFKHGVVARDGLTVTTDRQIRRAAAKATQYHGAQSEMMNRMFR